MNKLRSLSRGFLSKFSSKPVKRQRSRRRLLTEQLEGRVLLAGDLHNSAAPWDTNVSGEVTAIDALVVINKLNGVAEAESEGGKFVTMTDVNRDGKTTAIDALQVINFLAEGEGTTTFNITAVPLDQLSLFNAQSAGTNILSSFSGWGSISAGDQILLSDAVDSSGNIGNGFYTVTSVVGNDLTLGSPHGLTNFFGQLNVGRRISTIGTNTDFILGIVAEDVRPTDPDGPFAVFTDIEFDSSLASVTGLDITGDPNPESPTPNFKFNSFVNGKSGDFTTTPGLIDEAGAFRPAGAGLGDGTHLAFAVNMRTGNNTGTLDLILDAAGIIEGEDPNGPDFPSGLPAHDVLVNGSNVPVCQIIRTQFLANDTPPCTGMVMYNSAMLTITTGATANPDSASVDENGGPIFINVLANDTTDDGVKNIVAPIPTTSTEGGVVQQSGQGFNYTPPTNFVGADTFTYTLSNGAGTATDSALVTITVGVAGPSISGPTSLSTNEDTALTLSGFSIIDTDTSGATITVDLSLANNSGTLSTTSFSGTPTEVTSALNNVTYTPVLNSTTANTITIAASNGTASDSHSVGITINPIDDLPVFGNLPTSLTAFLNQPLNIPTFTVTDPDSTVTVNLSVSQGTLSSSTSSGGPGTFNVSGIIFTPPTGFISGPTINLTVQATPGGSPVNIPITVVPPVTPFAVSDFITIDEGTASGSVDVLENDLAENDKANLQIDSTSLPIPSNLGSVSQNGSTFTYTPPDPDFFGTASFTYTISDTVDGGDPSTGTVAITVNPINDPPVISISGGARTLDEDSDPTAISGISVTDIDNTSVDVTLSVNNGVLTAGGQSGSSITVGNGSLSGLTYEPNDNYFGPETLSISADDGTAVAVTDTVNITISPINDAPTLIVPGKQSFFTDFDNTFSSDPAPFSIDDIDALGNDVQVDLTIASGSLTISSPSGASVSPITGGIRLTGTVSEINDAFASGLDYNTSQPGDKTLAVTVNDLGNTGSGNQLTASATVDVEVLDFVPVDIVGQIFLDSNGDGTKGAGEPGIEGVDVRISGTDFQGNSLAAPSNVSTTNGRGRYAFLGLRPNLPGQPYTISYTQPSFIQGKPGASSTFRVTIDQSGNVSYSGGSVNGGQAGFVPEFADVFDHFIHLPSQPSDSGILVSSRGGSQDWSIFYGAGWDMDRYSNARLTINADGVSGVLTVFDSDLGQDRTANISTIAGTLTSRGKGSDKIYRVIGGSSILGSASSTSGANPEGEAVSSHSIFLRAVDAIMAGA